MQSNTESCPAAEHAAHGSPRSRPADHNIDSLAQCSSARPHNATIMHAAWAGRGQIFAEIRGHSSSQPWCAWRTDAIDAHRMHFCAASSSSGRSSCFQYVNESTDLRSIHRRSSPSATEACMVSCEQSDDVGDQLHDRSMRGSRALIPATMHLCNQVGAPGVYHTIADHGRPRRACHYQRP